ncbi:MAG: lysine--tRNA ligase [Candidatus Woesearchaeota archaeon]
MKGKDEGRNKHNLPEDRKIKLERIEDQGINPYPHKYDRTHYSSDIKISYAHLEEGEEAHEGCVSIAGRLTRLNRMGKLTFGDITDGEGKIQVCFLKDELGSDYENIKHLDIGDIIGVGGSIFRSSKGEVTVKSREYELLSKSLRGLPEKFHGLKDAGMRYRHRCLDMIANPSVIGTFRKRSSAIKAMRDFLDHEGFIEVETPLIQPIYGGASARPFKTYVNSLGEEHFLQISPELYLKRLMVGGMEKVYTISKNFRNEGIDRTHNPEFTMMECYQAYSDYNDMMRLTEDIYSHIFNTVLGTTKISYNDKSLDFSPPWRKASMYDLIKEVTGIHPDEVGEDSLAKLLYDSGYSEDDCSGKTKGELAMKVFEDYVEGTLIQPTFVTDHPLESTPLCKPHRERPDLIERFEPFVCGYEIGNAYSELNDPVLQRKLLEQEEEKGRGGQEEYHQMDEDFMHAIEVGMPPAGGLGLGIDRMVMFLTGSSTIKDVVPFPMVKREYQEND